MGGRITDRALKKGGARRAWPKGASAKKGQAFYALPFMLMSHIRGLLAYKEAKGVGPIARGRLTWLPRASGLAR